MRAVLASLLLAACATTSGPPPTQRVAGCWIERSGVTRTMRWFADSTQPGALIGAVLEYRGGSAAGSARYRLAQEGEGWRMCVLEGGTSGQCWQVAQGQDGSLEGGRVFIDSYGDRLRIAIVGEGERVIFDGRRDGCD